MIRLTKALSAFGSSDFEDILKAELQQLNADQLQLQQGLSTSSYALADTLKVMIISVSELAEFIRVKAGVFYAGIIAGCSCADDPTPVDVNNEFCEVQIDINKQTAEATIVVLTQ